MTCSVEFGHGWTRLRVVVLPFPQGWLSERNMRTRMKITKREECVTSLAGGYFHARTRISPTLLSVGKMRAMVGRRVRTRKRWGKRNFGKRGLRVLVSRELKQQRRRQLRKRHLWTGEFALPQICRAYSISFNSSNVGNFFWIWILKNCIKVQEKKRKVVVVCSRPRQNVKLGIFTC